MNYSAKSVSVVIPNWNGAVLLKKNFPQILAAARGAFEFIVADDASTDDSLNLLAKQFPKIKVISQKQHRGFASSVNAAVAVARGEIVVLLNTDVVPEKNFLPPLLSHFADVAVFAVGCLEQSIENNQTVLRGRGLAKWEKGFLVHSRGEVNEIDTAWVSGGSGAFRRAIWQKLGGMDSLFDPFYWEDLDLSYRALKAGYKLIFEPKSIVRHYHEEGIIKSHYSSGRVNQIAYRNQFIFIWKNLSNLNIWLEHCLFTSVRLIQAIFRLDLSLLVGYFAAIVRLPRIWQARCQSSQFWQKTDTAILIQQYEKPTNHQRV